MIDRIFKEIRDRAHRATKSHTQLEQHINTHYAHGQPLNHNETGIKAKNHVSDPTGQQATTRGATALELTELRRRRDAIAKAFDDYDNYARRIWGQDRPAPPNDAPTCYVAGCTREVGSYRRADETLAYRMGGEYGGMCDMHRMESIREKQAS